MTLGLGNINGGQVNPSQGQWIPHYASFRLLYFEREHWQYQARESV